MGSEVLVADDPQAFARSVVQLYRDWTLWESMSARGLEFAKQRFSRAAVRPVLERVLAASGVAPWEAGARPDSIAVRSVPGTAILPSRFMRDLYRRAGATFEAETLVPHGVWFGDATRPRADCSRLVELGPEAALCRRIVRFKGLDAALESVALLREEVDGLVVRLNIVGDCSDGAYVSELEQRVRQLGLQKQVQIAPAVPEHELFELFQQHDVLLFPSLFEPFSRSR